MDNKENDNEKEGQVEQIKPEDVSDGTSEEKAQPDSGTPDAEALKTSASDQASSQAERVLENAALYAGKVYKKFNDLLDLKGIREKLPEQIQEKIPANPRLITIPVFIFLAGFLLIILLGVFAPTAGKKSVDKTIPVVRVIEAVPEPIKIPLFSQGIVKPKKEFQIVSLVNGPVVEISPNLVDGGKVEEGELLVKVSSQSYERDKAKVEANLARVKSAQIAKQSELRVQGTLRSTSGTAQLREVNAAVRAAEADLERVNELIESTEITAPFSGIIRHTAIKKGQVIAPGTPIASLFSREAALVEVPLSDRQLSFIDTSRFDESFENLPEVKVKGEFGNNIYYWHGKLLRLAGGRNEVNRLQYASVEIPEPYGSDPEQKDRPDLSPGFFVEVEISGKQFENLIRLPRKVLKTNNRIWAVDQENLLKAYEPEIVHTDRSFVYVSSEGLPQDTRIIVSELEVFVQGLEVDPKLLESDRVTSSDNTLQEQTQDPEAEPEADKNLEVSEDKADVPDTENASTQQGPGAEEENAAKQPSNEGGS